MILVDHLGEGDDVWLLCRVDVADRFADDLVTRSGRPVYRAGIEGSHAWKLVGPARLDDAAIAGLSRLLPGTRLFESRMPAEQIYLSGTVALPGGLYIRRPLLPRASANGATAVTYRTYDSEGRAVADASMEQNGPGEAFAFPTSFDLSGVSTVRFDALGTSGLIATRHVEVVSLCTALQVQVARET